MAFDSDTWYGRHVLITGGDGFVAANLASTLLRRGANVVVTVRHLRPNRTLSLLGYTDTMPDTEMLDLSDLLGVHKLCNRHRVDTIFHLAASAIVSDASKSPISTFQNNIISTLNLLEAARVNCIPRVVIASSDKSYGDHANLRDPEPLPYREGYSLRGLDVYSTSKVCADMMSQTYAFQFRLPVIIARSCNVYGPGDLNFTRLIPRTILRLLSKKTPVINAGNAGVLREYIHVSDVVNAYCVLATNVENHYNTQMPSTGRDTYGWAAYNVGSFLPGDLQSVKEHPNIASVQDVMALIGRKMGCSDLVPKTIPKDITFIEIPDQYLDSSKLNRLGFKAECTLDGGLDGTIEWYTRHFGYLNRLGSEYLT